MKLSRRKAQLLPIQDEVRPASQAELEGLLADPQRLLQQLLSGEQLEPLGAGVFLYTPRPLELPGYRLTPQGRLQARWQAPQLEIRLVSYRLPGLANLERWADYQFAAQLEAKPGNIALQAHAQLELTSGTEGIRLPVPLLAFLGHRVLGLIFGRLERRCRHNLRSIPRHGSVT